MKKSDASFSDFEFFILQIVALPFKLLITD